MEFESLERIPDQIGTAMLDNGDGKKVKATGSLDSDDGKVACAQIYKILQDTSACLGDEPFKRWRHLSSNIHVLSCLSTFRR